MPTKRGRKLLFVCTGNLCRSPTSEAMFNALGRERGLEWHAESAGLSAVEGEPVAENIALALEEVGFDAKGHRARRVSARIAGEADLILTMTPLQKQKLEGLYGKSLADKLHTLPGYLGEGEQASIPDPHGYPISAHRASVRQLYGYIESLVERLALDENG